MRAPGAPTAIAAISDALALGVLQALADLGRTPGRDTAVTGFDDVPAAARAGLTTVRQPVAEKGRLMARMRLDAAFTERRVVLPTELIARASTLCARRAAPGAVGQCAGRSSTR